MHGVRNPAECKRRFHAVDAEQFIRDFRGDHTVVVGGIAAVVACDGDGSAVNADIVFKTRFPDKFVKLAAKQPLNIRRICALVA